METNHPCTRREFVKTLAVSAPVLASWPSMAETQPSPNPKRFQIGAFSKVFQQLNYEDTADLVAEVGWDGIECPVRKGGHVLPNRVEEDLPRMVEALKKRGKIVIHITTDVQNATDKDSLRVLRTASQLGIRVYRLGAVKYRFDQPIPKQLDEARARLKDLVDLNKELNLCAGFQNHSGSEGIGAPVWDIYEIIKDLDRRYIGAGFDIAHATIEGGYAWPIHAHLMEPYYAMVYVKDFAWKKGAKNWQAAWCPLGEGMISRSFFDRLKAGPYRGMISQHHEYPIGAGQEMVRALKQDLATLRSWLG